MFYYLFMLNIKRILFSGCKLYLWPWKKTKTNGRHTFYIEFDICVESVILSQKKIYLKLFGVAESAKSCNKVEIYGLYLINWV